MESLVSCDTAPGTCGARSHGWPLRALAHLVLQSMLADVSDRVVRLATAGARCDMPNAPAGALVLLRCAATHCSCLLQVMRRHAADQVSKEEWRSRCNTRRIGLGPASRLQLKATSRSQAQGGTLPRNAYHCLSRSTSSGCRRRSSRTSFARQPFDAQHRQDRLDRRDDVA